MEGLPQEGAGMGKRLSWEAYIRRLDLTAARAKDR